jgi:hypothetical protein
VFIFSVRSADLSLCSFFKYQSAEFQLRAVSEDFNQRLKAGNDEGVRKAAENAFQASARL